MCITTKELLCGEGVLRQLFYQDYWKNQWIALYVHLNWSKCRNFRKEYLYVYTHMYIHLLIVLFPLQAVKLYCKHLSTC